MVDIMMGSMIAEGIMGVLKWLKDGKLLKMSMWTAIVGAVYKIICMQTQFLSGLVDQFRDMMGQMNDAKDQFMIDSDASVVARLGEGVRLMNAVFPVDELLMMICILVNLCVCALVIKFAIKLFSLIPKKLF